MDIFLSKIVVFQYHGVLCGGVSQGVAEFSKPFLSVLSKFVQYEMYEILLIYMYMYIFYVLHLCDRLNLRS